MLKKEFIAPGRIMTLLGLVSLGLIANLLYFKMGIVLGRASKDTKELIAL
jgi:hypothetical protein